MNFSTTRSKLCIRSGWYLREAGLELSNGGENGSLCVRLQTLGQDLQHAIELIETDELMLAMNLVNACQTTEPPAIALSIHADHDNLPATVVAALLAEVLVLLKTHQL